MVGYCHEYWWELVFQILSLLLVVAIHTVVTYKFAYNSGFYKHIAEEDCSRND